MGVELEVSGMKTKTRADYEQGVVVGKKRLDEC